MAAVALVERDIHFIIMRCCLKDMVPPMPMILNRMKSWFLDVCGIYKIAEARAETVRRCSRGNVLGQK